MDQNKSFKIETKAARALASWKAFFAEQVAAKAKELAAECDSPGVITLGHYQQAASMVVQMLATAVQETDSTDDHQEAA